MEKVRMTADGVRTEIQDKCATLQCCKDELYQLSIDLTDENVIAKLEELVNICKKYQAMGVCLE